MLKQGAKIAYWRTEALLHREATPNYASACLLVAPRKRRQVMDNDRARLGVYGGCSAKRLRDETRLDHPTATTSQLAPAHVTHITHAHPGSVSTPGPPSYSLSCVSLPPLLTR